MTFTIEFGWWVAPVVFTLWWYGMTRWWFPPAKGPASAMDSLADLIRLCFFVIPVLIGWLIWALLT